MRVIVFCFCFFKVGNIYIMSSNSDNNDNSNTKTKLIGAQHKKLCKERIKKSVKLLNKIPKLKNYFSQKRDNEVNEDLHLIILLLENWTKIQHLK